MGCFDCLFYQESCALPTTAQNRVESHYPVSAMQKKTMYVYYSVILCSITAEDLSFSY